MSEVNPPEWERLPPIRSWPHEVYEHGDNEYYHVGAAVAAILASPSDYQFRWIEPEKLKPQLQGQGNIDPAYVANLSDDNAARPLLMITYPDGSARLIDGYHRASRALQRGAPYLGAWLLTPEQTDRFRLDTAKAKAIGFVAKGRE